MLVSAGPARPNWKVMRTVIAVNDPKLEQEKYNWQAASGFGLPSKGRAHGPADASAATCNGFHMHSGHL